MKLNDDQEKVDNRVNPLKDTDEAQITVPLREQIAERLYDKLVEKKAAETISDIWRQGNSDRMLWLTRQQEYLTQFDEFIDPIYDSATDWGSTIHLPTILTVCKTFHARFYSALLGQDPPFTVKSRAAANVDRARLVQDLMRYTLKDWSNEHLGINDVVDRWLWDWVTTGVGILKVGWLRKYTRFEDVETVQIPTVELASDPQTGETIQVPSTRQEDRIINREIRTFDGPEIKRINVEDLLIVGGEGEPQKADYVLESLYLTASDLFTFADQKIFKLDVVKEIIRSGENRKSAEDNSGIKQRRFEHGGLEGPDKEYDLDRYHILEAYVKMDVDGSGINSEVVIWVHPETKQILRASYLYRMMPTGQRPYFKIDFYKRQDAEYGAGLPELLYSLAKEIDAMHNMRVDIGIITSMPFGFYQPSAGTPEEKLEIEPGALIPIESPSQNVFFPNLGNRTAFGFQEEASLNQQISRLTSISDLSLGVIGGQGATRTATGTRALVGEANANLDIFLQRMNYGWKQILQYVFYTLQQKLPPGFQFRVTGEDGNAFWAKIESREELRGMFDFELEPNSAASNPSVQMQMANQIYQLTANPLDMQLGLISPLERYEAIKNLMQVMGIRDFHRYVRKPGQIMRVFTPLEVINRLLSGIDVPLDPTQDLQGIIALVDEFVNVEELNGMFGPNEIGILQSKAAEAAALLQQLQAQQAQQANLQQQQTNQLAGEVPGNVNVNVLAQQGGFTGEAGG